MKRYFPWILLCLVFSALGHAEPVAQGSRSYHKLVTGTHLDIVLESNPTTGFDWQLTNAELQYVPYVSLEKKEFIPQDNPTQSVGVPGRTLFRLKMNKAIDPLVLLFTYKRPWEADYAAAWHVAVITVVDHASRKVCHPLCQNTGTDGEGWYSSCSQELIKREKCAGLPAPYCGALKTRSEGWYSGQGLIHYDKCFDDRIPVPRCVNEGQENEGWDAGDHFVKASCQGLQMTCAAPLSKSEGFWALDEAKYLSLVGWTLCMLEEK
jgi:predicted secreted protein